MHHVIPMDAVHAFTELEYWTGLLDYPINVALLGKSLKFHTHHTPWLQYLATLMGEHHRSWLSGKPSLTLMFWCPVFAAMEFGV